MRQRLQHCLKFAQAAGFHVQVEHLQIMQSDSQEKGMFCTTLEEMDELLAALSQVFAAITALIIYRPELGVPDLQLFREAQGVTIHIVPIRSQHKSGVPPGFIIQGGTMSE